MHHSSFRVRYTAALVIASLLTLPARLTSQTPAAPVVVIGQHANAPTIAAARRSGPVQVDGKLDEGAWQAATPYTNFIQMDPSEGQPASERTEARVLIDDDAIYIGVRMHDSNPA